MGLTAYIRTFNEAPRIEDTVRAALQVADEVLVIDGASPDGTGDLARAAGARVIINTPYPGNGYQKRFAEEHATHDWLLDIDADEHVTPELAVEIKETLKNPNSSVYALKLVTVPPIGKPWHDFALAYRNKLYDRRHHRQPEDVSADQFKLPKGMKAIRLKCDLLHYAFDGIGQHIGKFNRNTDRHAVGKRLKPLWALRLRILFGIPFYFFKKYVQKGLWKGGLYGFAIAMSSAFGRWLTDVKMYEIHKKQKGQ